MNYSTALPLVQTLVASFRYPSCLSQLVRLTLFLLHPSSPKLMISSLHPLSLPPSTNPARSGSGNGLSVSLHGKERGFSIALGALNLVKGIPMPLDLCSISQKGQPRLISFLSTALGIMADLDLGTEHLRWMGDARFVTGLLQAGLYRLSLSSSSTKTSQPTQPLTPSCFSPRSFSFLPTAVKMPSWSGSILIKITSSSPYATCSPKDNKRFLCDSLASRRRNGSIEPELRPPNETIEGGLPKLRYPDGPPPEGSDEREKEWEEVVKGGEKGVLFA
jgi:hypothetical protein